MLPLLPLWRLKRSASVGTQGPAHAVDWRVKVTRPPGGSSVRSGVMSLRLLEMRRLWSGAPRHSGDQHTLV